MITRMQAERLRRGWTQPELGARAGMSAPDISRIENGRLLPYPIQAARLTKALRLEPDVLLDLVPDPRDEDRRL